VPVHPANEKISKPIKKNKQNFLYSKGVFIKRLP